MMARQPGHLGSLACCIPAECPDLLRRMYASSFVGFRCRHVGVRISASRVFCIPFVLYREYTQEFILVIAINKVRPGVKSIKKDYSKKST